MKKILLSFVILLLTTKLFSQNYIINNQAWINADSYSGLIDNDTSNYTPFHLTCVPPGSSASQSIVVTFNNQKKINYFKYKYSTAISSQAVSHAFQFKFKLSYGSSSTGPWTVVFEDIYGSMHYSYPLPSTTPINITHSFDITSKFWKIDLYEYSESNFSNYIEPRIYEVSYAQNPIINSGSNTFPNDNCVTLNANSADNYLWSTSETSQSVNVCGTSNYTVTTTVGGIQYTDNLGVFISDFSNTQATPNGKIYSMYENSGKLYFGGDFDYVGMVSGNTAQIDNSTGFFDSNMPRINGIVNCVIPDGAGGWFVGGLFTRAGVYNLKNLVHIKADKSVDALFKPEPNGEVKSLILVGNKIYAAGSFTMVGEVSRGYLAQLDVSTGMASSWNPMVNGAVASIALYNNNIIAGGSFTIAGGLSRNYLAAIDTVYAQSSTFNPNPDNSVNKVVVSGTKLYIAGSFANIVATSRNKLACILLTSETLTSWNPNPNNIVYDIFPTLSAIYVCGDFTTIGGQTRNYLASLNTSAGTALTWNPNPNNTVYSILVNGSDIIAGGKFTLIGSDTRNYLANISSTTGLANSWNPDVHGFKGSTPFVKAISLFGTYTYAGGSFYSLGGQTRNNAACIDIATGQISTWNPNVNNIVHAVYADNNYVYIGGEFTQVNGSINKNRIAQLNVSNAVATGWNPNSDGIVHTLTAKGLYLYAGGEFANIGNNPRPKLAAIKLSDGTSSTWNPSPNNTVRALSIMGDTIYIGGDFTTIGGQTRNRIAAYGITSTTLLNFNPNANNIVNAIATKNNKIYVGGNFTNIGGASRNNFASFNAINGNINSANPFYFNNTSINAVNTSDSVVYIGGLNSFYNNNSLFINKNASAIDNNSQQFSSYWHPEPNNTIRSICVFNDKIFLGGDFTEVLSVFQPFFVSVDNYCVANAHVADPFTHQFCEGDGVYLNADTNSHYSYQWYLNNSPIAGADSSSYSPIITGLYNVEVTDNLNYGSVFSNSVSVIVDQLADSTISTLGNTTFCGTGNVTLTAATGTSYVYQWYKDGSVISGQTSNSYIATTGGNYYCEILNASGCPRISQHITLISNSLTPTITNNSGVTTICQGQSVNLSSSYTSGNLWYKDNVSTGITTQTFSASQSGIYKLYVLNGGCSGFSSDIAITVNPLPASAGVISGTSTVCQNQNSVTYSVPSITDATSYIWSLPTGATGTSNTNSITVNYGLSAVSSNITVKGSNSCGDGTTSTLAITVNPLVANAGTISGTATVCQGQNSVTYTVPVIANATSYIWSLPTGATGTSSTNSITVNYSTSAVSGNITVKGSNSCGDGSTSTLAITVNPLVANAGTISGTSTVCQGQNSVTYTVPAIANATSYIWSLPSGATGSSSTNNITVNYGSSAVSGDITVKGNNSCGDGTTSTLAITVNPLVANAGTISGATTVCQGQNSVTYTVPSIANATSYIWSLPTGASGTSSTNSITVNYGTSAISGNITVKGTNSCGDGSSSLLAITVNPIAGNAGTISGLSTVCQGQNSVTYTVPSIANATSYIWSLPTGATGTSTTNSITIDYGSSAVSGNITVKGTNTCGDGAISTLAVTVNSLVGNAGTISGTTTVCQGQNSVTYTVPVIANATSYIWSLPTGATGTSSTNSITVNYSTSAVSGDIAVKGTNSCGDGLTSTLTITVNNIPATPVITLVGNNLHSDAVTGNQWYNQSGSISGATSQDYSPLTNDNYYVIVTLNGCSSSPSNIINYVYTGISSINADSDISVFPNPNNGKFQITFNVPTSQNIKIGVFNSIGQSVYAVNKNNFNGQYSQPIDLSGLSKGVYLINTTIGTEVHTNKITIE